MQERDALVSHSLSHTHAEAKSGADIPTPTSQTTNTTNNTNTTRNESKIVQRSSSPSNSNSNSNGSGDRKDRLDREESLCCCCWELPKSVVLLPCRHMCVCEACGMDERTLPTCPMCREQILQRIKVFT